MNKPWNFKGKWGEALSYIWTFFNIYTSRNPNEHLNIKCHFCANKTFKFDTVYAMKRKKISVLEIIDLPTPSPGHVILQWFLIFEIRWLVMTCFCDSGRDRHGRGVRQQHLQWHCGPVQGSLLPRQLPQEAAAHLGEVRDEGDPQLQDRRERLLQVLYSPGGVS